MVVTRSNTDTTAPKQSDSKRNPRLHDVDQPMPCGSRTKPAFEEPQPAGTENIALMQKTLEIPSGTALLHQPNSSGKSKHSTKHSHASSAAILAQKLAIEAEFQQRRVQRERERERKLELLQQQADEIELQAKLASLEARSIRSCSSSAHDSRKERVSTWVSNQNVPNIPLDARTQVLPKPQASVDNGSGAPTSNNKNDPFSKLANVISTLPDRPRKPELVPFSGNVNEWLAFKCTYDRTKTFFTPAENLARLISAIRGAAREAISSVLWSAQDPEEVMFALQQNFARPEQLIKHEIAGLKSIKTGNPEHLNTLANKLRNCVAILKLFKQDEYLCSIELFRTVLLKLSEQTRDRFTDYAATHKPFEPTVTKLELLSRFLMVEAERQLSFNFLIDVTAGPSYSGTSFHKPKITNNLGVHSVTENNFSGNGGARCTYCNEGQAPHTIKACKKFASLTVDERWRWVRESKTCYRCLKSNPHTWNNCRAKRCGIDACTRRHHALLHGDTAAFANNSNSFQNTTNNTVTNDGSMLLRPTEDVVASTCGEPAAGRRGLLKILPVVLEGPNGIFQTYALLDEGSTATLIDGEVAARIGAAVTDCRPIRITGVGGMVLETNVSYVNFYIRGRDLAERYFIQGARAITPLHLAPQTTDELDFSKYGHLVDLTNILAYQNVTPTVLIGAADWNLSVSREMRVGQKNEPVASRTLLGWVLHGAISSVAKPTDFIHHANENCSYASRTHSSLENLIKKQYEIESLGIQKHVLRQSSVDARAIFLVETSAQRLTSGHFEVGLPWKENVTSDVPDSYQHALSRLKSLEKKMSKDEVFASAYKVFINSMIQKGYAEECELSSCHDYYLKNKYSADLPLRWYLPHFGVFHPQKRKLRVVHDAAAVTKDISLNSMLLQGPDLLQSLLDILFRFREGSIAFSADIREMFPQIKINERDRDALRFLWRNGNTQLAVKEYRMSSLIFGAVSSPFIAIYIKNKNAKDFEHKYPAATQAIINDHYMDDFIGSQFILSDAKQLASDIVTVHKAGGFEMRSWVSNIPEALALVPKELHAQNSNSDVSLPPGDDIGALGVRWNPMNDTISFRTNLENLNKQNLTKRSLLSNVMSIYDPLGLLTPITIQGRIIIQKLWREGTDWDAPIPPKYEAECKIFFQQLASVASLRIPRWYVGRTGLCDTQLHVIADGGEQAYACVAYWRHTFFDGSVRLALIGSKARVSPLKPLSIPRIELQAALIATRFAQCILKAHRTQPSAIFYWTDSTTVLKWIRSDARNFKTFVAHRLGEILEFTNPSDWKWLPSELNVADDATKPKQLEFTLSHRWFTGPSFLFNQSTEWPNESESNVDETSRISELKPEFVAFLVDNFLPDPPVPDSARFSSWLRLLRTTARVLQAIRIFCSRSSLPRLRGKYFHNTASPSQPSVDDILQAEKILFQRVQKDTFSEELKILKASKPLPKSSRIAALAPILDQDNIIRLYSRIKSAPGVSENMKSPIILDGHHRIVKLFIHHKHVEAGHGNHELVLNEIRQSYWILRARTTIRSVAKACLKCKRQKGKLVTPPTGDLPLERLDHHTRPFTHVGLDYFGPIEVAIGRRREKRYVALYTCLVTRGIHLEVVASLSSDSAIMSLRRLISRRGTPSTIFSDNGTNFVGANRELTSLYNETVEIFASSRKIIWRFIPPASPFMGGAWERLVRSVKTALRATLKDRAPREEVLATLLAEAEAIVNSRPLTYVPNSPDAPEAITPFHFILGTSSVTQWPVKLTDTDLQRRCDWRHALRLADHFWGRWLTEYLPTLIPRGRINSNTESFCEGDVVLVADKTLPRGLWLLGRIVKTFSGPDGLVRVVDIVTKGGTLRRPIRKILHIGAEQPASFHHV